MHRNLSIYLDLVRFLSAMLVFVVHANYQRFTGGLPVLGHLSDLGNDAVMAFFVLSGFVIAFVVNQKERNVREYAASRLARLYSVVVPALILTMLLDAVGSQIAPDLYTGRWFAYDNPLWRVLASLTFTNELWFSYTRPFSNGPFWSLGYEPWYYALFGAAHFLSGHLRYFAVGAICLVMGPKILLLLPVWLLGVWAYRRTVNSTMSLSKGVALFFGSMAAYLSFRLLEGPDYLLELSKEIFGEDVLYDKLSWSRKFMSSYVIGVCVALHFVGAATIAERWPRIPARLERPIRYAAGFTFALYLMHYPLLQFFAGLTPVIGWEEHRAAFVALGTLISVWLVGARVERQKGPLRDLFLHWSSKRQGEAAASN
jgi:peptidoglycan/LPS O-acetylase OafA/YrhL